MNAAWCCKLKQVDAHRMGTSSTVDASGGNNRYGIGVMIRIAQERQRWNRSNDKSSTLIETQSELLESYDT